MNKEEIQPKGTRKSAPGENMSGPPKKKAGSASSKPEAQPTGQEPVAAGSAGGKKTPNEAVFRWAEDQLTGQKPPVPKALTLDLSNFEANLGAALVVLIQRLQLDGLGEMPLHDGDLLKDLVVSQSGLEDAQVRAIIEKSRTLGAEGETKHLQVLAADAKVRAVKRMLLVRACAESPWRLGHTFLKLTALMVDCIVVGRVSPNEKSTKSGDIMAGTLANLVYNVQRLLMGRDKPDRNSTFHRLWEEPAFKERLQALQRRKKSYSPKRQFADFVCDKLIGYVAANAKLNGKSLQIKGRIWKRPTSTAEFNEMRAILQAESVRHLLVYAGFCDEDDAEGIGNEVRALKTDQERNQYYHKSEFDEAFRSYFGLSKPRKKKAAKTTKTQAKPAKRTRKKSRGNSTVIT